jgi:hypothetical protein
MADLETASITCAADSDWLDPDPGEVFLSVTRYVNNQ